MLDIYKEEQMKLTIIGFCIFLVSVIAVSVTFTLMFFIENDIIGYAAGISMITLYLTRHSLIDILVYLKNKE